MVQGGKLVKVLYNRYNPLVRSVSSIGLQNQRKKVSNKQNYNRFRSQKPPKNPRDVVISEPKPKKDLSESYHLDYRKPKYKHGVPKKGKRVTDFPIFVTKSQFALQRQGSGKSLVVNPSKGKIARPIVRREVKRKRNRVGHEFIPIGRKYKMIASNKKPPRYKMSRSSMNEIKSIAKRVESKSDDEYGSRKNLNENEWEAYKNNEPKNLDPHKKNPDIYGNILGPTTDEAILAGLQTVIEMCSIVDRKPVKKSSIQEVNKQKIMDWVESEYILLNEEIKTSTSDLSTENLSERKETLQEIEVLVRKKYELENKGAKLKNETENLCKSSSRQLSVFFATQPSTNSDLDLESLENSSEMLNAIRVSHSIQKSKLEISKSSNIFEVYTKPALSKKNQLVQTVCLCDKATQVMELPEEIEPAPSESMKSITIVSNKLSEHSIDSSETSSISLVEIKSSIKYVQASSCDESFKCSHVTKSTQFTPDLPLVCTKSTQVSKTNFECENYESSSESSSSSCSSEQSSEQIPNTRPQIVNYFKVYTNKNPLSTTSSKASVNSSSNPSSSDKSMLNATIKTMEQKKILIDKSCNSVMVKCTPIQLDTTSSIPHVPLKSASTSTTGLKPKALTQTVTFIPIQSTKSGQTIESKPCLHVENFTPTMIEPILPIIPKINFSEKSVQTTMYDDTTAQSSQTNPPPEVCSQAIQIPLKSQSTIDLMSKHVQTRKFYYPCMQSTQTLVESVNTSMEAHSSTLMVQKSVQTKITFDQPCESLSDTNSTCVKTTADTTSATSLDEESSSYAVSSKPTVDTITFKCGNDVANVTTQCDSIPLSNAATSPLNVKIASCQTSLSHWKCIRADYPSTSTAACFTQRVPAYQKRVIQMCNVNTCPMLQEAMVNIAGEPSTKKCLVQTDKRSYSSPRIQVCSTSTCPMLKSASVNICADYKFNEEVKTNKTGNNRRIQMCSSRNCRMLREAIINITNLDSKQQKGDSSVCQIHKLKSVKSKKGSAQKCSAKTCPILQQAIVNICNIEEGTDSSKTIAPKCSCYKANRDDAYVTCQDFPLKACAGSDDCYCENEEEEEDEEVESQQFDDREYEDEEVEKVPVAGKTKVGKIEKVAHINEDVHIIQKLSEAPKIEIREINEPERIELTQYAKNSPEVGSSRAVVFNKDTDKGKSKSSTRRTHQLGQTVKQAIHIRIPSPAQLPSAAWAKKK